MKPNKIVLFLLSIVATFLTGCEQESHLTTTVTGTNGGFTVHFIDVGQADAALILSGNQTMLIDGGNVADSDLIVAYLREQGVQTLDYVVGTHGHEDHIGGLAAALSQFPTNEVWSPVSEYSSNAFANFAKYAQEQGLSLIKPEPNHTFMLGEAQVTVLGPVKEYSNANNTSIVLRIDYGSTSFLFTGDIERAAEEDLIESGAYLKADVLKVCHHGSNSSSTYPFIYAVEPKYGVISSGEGNDYGHPDEEVLSRFRDSDTILYRTDLQGHIIARSDGENITFETNRNFGIVTNPTVATPTVQLNYIGNINSKVVHLSTCSSLPNEQNRIYFDNRSDAIDYKSCGICNP